MFIFNKHFIRSHPILLGVILSGSLLMSLVMSVLFAGPTFAAMTSNTKPSDRATSYSYLKALNRCVQSHMRSSIQTEEGTDGATSPTQGVWGQQSGYAGASGTRAGEWFDDADAWVTVYPGGKTDCAELMRNALALWGWSDSKQFLQDIGYTYNDQVPAWERSDNESQRIADFNTAVSDKVGNVTALLDNAAKYALYLGMFTSDKEFMSSCDARQLGVLSSLDSTQQNAARENQDRGGRTYTVIKLYDPITNSMVDYGYSYLKQGEGGGTTTYASTWNYRGSNSTGGNDSNGERYPCSYLVSRINPTAPAFFQWNRDHPNDLDAVPGVTGPATGNNDCATGETCEIPATSCAIEGVGWMVCPVITFLASIADGAFGFLADSFLRTDPSAFTTDTPTYGAWGIMRNIANILFVIAFLVIIFSQLTGVGVSNYGVKKLLPRIIISAILVNVSYIIAQLAIDISNILGYSIRDVFDGISNQVRGETYAQVEVSSLTTGSSFSDIAVGILAFSGAAVALYALISTFGAIILAAVFALLMILFMLVARQVIIVLLVVLAPIAFVALLLPNTEKLFKFWRKSLTAMLLLFPIIALVFGAAALTSTLLQGSYTEAYSGEGSNWFGQIIASAILVLPLFIVPVLLRKSLDGVPALGQIANRWQGKANSNMGRKLGESYKNSAWGRGRAVRKQARQNFRDRKFASNVVDGGVRGKIAGIASGGIGKTEQQQYTRQSLDRSAIAVAEKARNEDVSTAASLMLEKHKNPSTQITKVSEELESAIVKGDITKARAAQSILLNSGGAGLDTLATTLEKSFTTQASRDSDVGVSLRNALNSAGLKGKNNVVASWAYDKNVDDEGKPILGEDGKQLDTSFAGIRSRTSTFSALSSAELGGQRLKELQKAIKLNPNAISPEQAHEVLNSPDVIKDMDLKKLELFQSIANKNPSTAQTTSATHTPNSTTTTATTATSTITTPTITPDGGLTIPHGPAPTVQNPVVTTQRPIATAQNPIATTAPTAPTAQSTPTPPVAPYDQRINQQGGGTTAAEAAAPQMTPEWQQRRDEQAREQAQALQPDTPQAPPTTPSAPASNVDSTTSRDGFQAPNSTPDPDEYRDGMNR